MTAPGWRPPAVVTVVAPPAPDTVRLSLSPSFAPFLPVGPASSYFSFGLFPALLVNLQFVTSGGRFAVGLCAGMNFFSATGPTDSASSFLVPLGVDVRYEIGSGAPFLAFAHVAGLVPPSWSWQRGPRGPSPTSPRSSGAASAFRCCSPPGWESAWLPITRCISKCPT